MRILMESELAAVSGGSTLKGKRDREKRSHSHRHQAGIGTIRHKHEHSHDGDGKRGHEDDGTAASFIEHIKEHYGHHDKKEEKE